MPFYRMEFGGNTTVVHLNLGRKPAPLPCVGPAREGDDAAATTPFVFSSAFYARKRTTPAAPLEFICPASDEAYHRTTCQSCQLCRGTSSPARSVVIVAHGNNSAKANFYRSRPEAVA